MPAATTRRRERRRPRFASTSGPPYRLLGRIVDAQESRLARRSILRITAHLKCATPCRMWPSGRTTGTPASRTTRCDFSPPAAGSRQFSLTSLRRPPPTPDRGAGEHSIRSEWNRHPPTKRPGNAGGQSFRPRNSKRTSSGPPERANPCRIACGRNSIRPICAGRRRKPIGGGSRPPPGPGPRRCKRPSPRRPIALPDGAAATVPLAAPPLAVDPTAGAGAGRRNHRASFGAGRSPGRGEHHLGSGHVAVHLVDHRQGIQRRDRTVVVRVEKVVLTVLAGDRLARRWNSES